MYLSNLASMKSKKGGQLVICLFMLHYVYILISFKDKNRIIFLFHEKE